MAEAGFSGAKGALLTRGNVLAILRDDRPDIPFPGLWDLPGGGREGEERPEQCFLREVREELGLALDPSLLHWGARFDGAAPGPGQSWFFVAHLPDFTPEQVQFGDEGQEWRPVPVETFLGWTRVVPHLQARLRHYLAKRAPTRGGKNIR